MSYGDNGTVDLYYGDLLKDFFDQKNNMVNPPSDVGFFLYNLFGKTFDDIQDIINQMLLNTDPVTCELPYLSIIATEWGLKRCPTWGDDKWRAVVIYYYYNLETIAGIEFVLNLLNDYNNQDPDTIPPQIIVNGFGSIFNLSDKYDSFNKCSDKYDELDLLGSMTDQDFVIDLNGNAESGVITELITIIEDGGVICQPYIPPT
jgi:hypothetical protein